MPYPDNYRGSIAPDRAPDAAEIEAAWEARRRHAARKDAEMALHVAMSLALDAVERIDCDDADWPIPGYDKVSTLELLREMGGLA